MRHVLTAVALVVAIRKPGAVGADVIALEGVAVGRDNVAASAPADVEIDLAEAAWQPQPTWLSNPTPRHSTKRDDERRRTFFRVDEPGRGMKWNWAFARELDLTHHRYLAMRYQARNLRRHHDYALCFLGQTANGESYEEVVRGIDLQADAHRRTVVVPLHLAAKRIPKAQGMAIQVQAEPAPAELHVESVRLVSNPPFTPLADVVPLVGGATFNGFSPLDLAPVCNQSMHPVLQLLRVSGWPTERDLTAHDVPFRLRSAEPALAATGIEAKTRLTIPVNRRASQVFLLMLAVLRGQEEPVHGSGALARIDGVDRFHLRLVYDDGSVDECLPGNATTGRFEVLAGPQVLCAMADATKTLASVTVCDVTPGGGFAVAAATCRTDGDLLHAAFDESSPPTPIKRWDVPPQPGKQKIEIGQDGRVTISNDLLRIELATSPSPCVQRLTDKIARRDVMPFDRVGPLVEMTVNGRKVEPNQLRRTTEPHESPDPRSVMIAYDVLPCPGLQLQLGLGLTDTGALRLGGRLVNRGQRSHRVGVICPRIGPYVLGDDLTSNEYVFPCRAAVIGRAPAALEERYSGTFGVQFMATVNPAAGQGLHLRTEDTTCIERNYILCKEAAGMFLAIRYPERSIAPGETRPLADTILSVGDGDWHRALDDYGRWLKTWYKPASPRKRWFREVFNFRQRFLHWLDPLYDAKSGRIDLERAVAEARKKFGGIDYLHIFDWGNCGPHGRIYGRIGDYNPYDFITGGRRNLHDAIARVRRAGVPVGLYIEGYLLDERGKLGQLHGREWQLIRPDGTGARWPNSSEIFICPGVGAWRDVQTATYAAKVRELDVDGMYIDQFGFTGSDKNCHSDKHGHPVPSYPVQTELETTCAIRQAVDAAKAGVAIYTEESPCDVTSQYQDGSFTYEMNRCHARRATIPLNMFRFAVPDFKTFEILICDQPTGSWATGVGWTFFNGEGLWLEGPADEWFTPETLATIRQCHAILRRHRDAFTSDHPRPLVDTLVGGVPANYFPTSDKDLWTLYNVRHRTFRGEVLRVGHKPGWTWRDAWHDRACNVRRDGGFDVISADVGPHGVGCLVRSATPTSR